MSDSFIAGLIMVLISFAQPAMKKPGALRRNREEHKSRCCGRMPNASQSLQDTGLTRFNYLKTMRRSKKRSFWVLTRLTTGFTDARKPAANKFLPRDVSAKAGGHAMRRAKLGT